jgi:hypothetical protein
MGDQSAIRQAIVKDYFLITGEAVAESDPIVTGAIFFSHKLSEAATAAIQQINDAARSGALEIREAGKAAAHDLREASQKIALEASEAAVLANRSTAAAEGTVAALVEEREQHLRAVEARMLKCVKVVEKRQSSGNGLSHVPIKYAIAGAVAGGIALAGLFYFGVEKIAERERQASIGRAFSRAVPTLEPKLRQQLLDHLEKTR